MKKQILFIVVFLSLLVFSSCSKKESSPIFEGFWKGDNSTIFEVFKENENSYTIRNINGSLSAKIQNDSLKGKNNLNMEFSMIVKKDSAFYSFGGLTTAYKRIDKSSYDEIFKNLKPMTGESSEENEEDE